MRFDAFPAFYLMCQVNIVLDSEIKQVLKN